MAGEGEGRGEELLCGKQSFKKAFLGEYGRGGGGVERWKGIHPKRKSILDNSATSRSLSCEAEKMRKKRN